MNGWLDPAPGEREAGERSWRIVRRGYEERLPAARERRHRPMLAAAVGIAVLAAALSPPGLAVWDSLRDAVENEDRLVALPTAGRILVNTRDGAWVVSQDGSKRFLSGYTDAAWSPHGLYIAAARANQLVAMEPNGKVHWKLARRGRVSAPRWSYEGFRIAYFAARALRIVNGDGTGDRLLTRDARPGIAAWEPGTHALAYITRAGMIAVTNVDNGGTVYIRTRLAPRQLQWTPDRRLVATGSHAVGVFWRRGPQLRRIGSRTPIAAAAVSPNGKRIAISSGGDVTIDRRRVFSGQGRVAGIAWSPNGRWLVVDWASADQWLFIRTPAKKLVVVSNIRAGFGAEPAIAGWCCP
jgi:WD40 repeat protein